MKKLAITFFAFLIGYGLVQAQIPVRSTKPIQTDKPLTPQGPLAKPLTPQGPLATKSLNAENTGTSGIIQTETLTQVNPFLPPMYNETQYATRYSHFNPRDRSYAFHAVDYDGNGIKDIAFKDFVYDNILGWWFQSPDGFSIEQKSAHNWSMYSQIGFLGYQTVEGDVNGDGRPDLIAINPALKQLGLIASSAPINNLGFPVYQLSNGNQYLNLPAHLSSDFIGFPGDFNGDKRGDVALWFYQSGEWHIALSNGTFVQLTENAWTSGFVNSLTSSQPVTGDFNGDGLTDIALRDNEKGSWTVALNTGNQSFVQSSGCVEGYWSYGWQTDYYTLFRSGDFNGDRLDDLLAFNPNDASWQFVLSSGSCFHSPSAPIILGDINTYPLVADLNRDGRADLVACNLNPTSMVTGPASKVVLQISLNSGK